MKKNAVTNTFSLPLLITITSSTKYESFGNFENDFGSQFCSNFDFLCDFYGRALFPEVQTGPAVAVFENILVSIVNSRVIYLELEVFSKTLCS